MFHSIFKNSLRQMMKLKLIKDRRILHTTRYSILKIIEFFMIHLKLSSMRDSVQQKNFQSYLFELFESFLLLFLSLLNQLEFLSIATPVFELLQSVTQTDFTLNLLKQQGYNINQNITRGKTVMINFPFYGQFFYPGYIPYSIFLLPQAERIQRSKASSSFVENRHFETQMNSKDSEQKHGQFISKMENNIVLTFEDLSQNKETPSYHGLYINSICSQQKTDFSSRKLQQLKQFQILKFEQQAALKKGKALRQKENRNIYSNLLRIFMRNVLEVDHYLLLINKIIVKYSLDCTVKDFYHWLTSFNINFKNYIRFKELSKIISKRNEGHKDYQLILNILMRNFLNVFCIEHCLTSKKIRNKGRMMHMEGVRLLERQIKELLQKSTEP